MNYYAYITDTPFEVSLKDEPLGSDGRQVAKDLRTLRGMINRMKRLYPRESFKVYSFTNLYKPSSFCFMHGYMPTRE